MKRLRRLYCRIAGHHWEWDFYDCPSRQATCTRCRITRQIHSADDL
jgi:hypothetical protein